MLIQETTTDLPTSEVLQRARDWFMTRFTPYGASVEDESDSHLKLTCEAGEVVIGTTEQDGRTLVRGSSSRLHHEISQFLVTLAPPEDVRQNAAGPGTSGAG